MRALAAATLVVATALGAPVRAAEADPPPAEYPRALAAASALRFSQSIADALKTPTTAAIVHAIGGAAADGWTVIIAGNLFSAIGALGAADGEWLRVAEIARRRHDADLLSTALAQRVEIALSQGDYARCETLALELAGVAGPSGNRIQAAFAEANLGVIERRRGHLDSALEHQERARGLYRAALDP
jgi:hypothetical protein